MGEPGLRPVTDRPDADAPVGAPPQADGSATRTSRRWLVVLGIALALTLALLVWSRVELSRTTTLLESRIATLERDVVGLQGEVARRTHVIDAQRDRLGRVRENVGALQRLLEEPLPEP